MTIAVARPETPALPEELSAKSIFAAGSVFSEEFMVTWGSVKPAIRVLRGFEVECSRKIRLSRGRISCHKRPESNRSKIDEKWSFDYRFGPEIYLPAPNSKGFNMANERPTELRRRRQRKAKLTLLKKRLEKASKSEKAVIIAKVRRLSPGAEQLVANWKVS